MITKRGTGTWTRAKLYLQSHPNATTEEVCKAANCPPAAVHQQRNALGIKGPKSSGRIKAKDALRQYRKVRPHLNESPQPTSTILLKLDVYSGPAEIALHRGGESLGRICISVNGEISIKTM